MYQQYRIHIDTKTKFSDKNGKEITDPSNNPELQKSIKQFLTQSQAKI